jgi:hypothetical protein
VRAGSRFCQQCGERLDATPGEEEAAEEGAGASLNANTNVSAGAVEASQPPPQAPEGFAGAFRRPGAPARAAAEEVKEVKPAPEEVKEVKTAYEEFKRAAPSAPPSAPVVERPSASAPVVEKSAVETKSPAAATEAARGRRAAAVRESLRPRVERVRDASMGVIEEASEDTGLRFVLISVAFFLLFLLLLLLNYMLK